jgi:hypothetical protein
VSFQSPPSNLHRYIRIEFFKKHFE